MVYIFQLTFGIYTFYFEYSKYLITILKFHSKEFICVFGIYSTWRQVVFREGDEEGFCKSCFGNPPTLVPSAGSTPPRHRRTLPTISDRSHSSRRKPPPLPLRPTVSCPFHSSYGYTSSLSPGVGTHHTLGLTPLPPRGVPSPPPLPLRNVCPLTSLCV